MAMTDLADFPVLHYLMQAAFREDRLPTRRDLAEAQTALARAGSRQ